MDFFRKNKNKVIVAIVTITLLIIMGFTNDERTSITKIEKIIGGTVTPINKVSFNFRKKTSDFFWVVKNLSKILNENKTLKEEIAILKEENREQENIIGKFDYLKNEAELKQSTDLNIIKAQITSKEPGNWYSRFLIDKGTEDGIKKDSTVIQGIEVENDIIQEGLVGRVSDVGNNWAKIISTVDELNKIAFKILRTQDGGVISGSVDGKLQGYLFDNKADVIVGDRIYTSGLGSKFKKDVYVGDVSEIIEVEEQLMKKIVVEPAVDFKKIYNVFVIMD